MNNDCRLVESKYSIKIGIILLKGTLCFFFFLEKKIAEETKKEEEFEKKEDKLERLSYFGFANNLNLAKTSLLAIPRI